MTSENAPSGPPGPPVTSPSIVLLTLAHRIESELGAALAPLGLTVSRLGLLCPRQRDVLAAPRDGGRLRTLSMLAGIYNLPWAVVVVVMIVRPGAYR